MRNASVQRRQVFTSLVTSVLYGVAKIPTTVVLSAVEIGTDKNVNLFSLSCLKLLHARFK